MSISTIGAAGSSWLSTVTSDGGLARTAEQVQGRLTALTAGLGVDRSLLADFVAGGSRLSFATVSTGSSSAPVAATATALKAAGMPMTSDGYPDFDAVLAAGGTVTGMLQPDGSPMLQCASNLGTSVAYAAVVDLGDGTPPFLVRGGDARAADGQGAGGRVELLNQLASMLDRAPDDLTEGRLWAYLNDWPTQHKGSAALSSSLEAWT